MIKLIILLLMLWQQHNIFTHDIPSNEDSPAYRKMLLNLYGREPHKFNEDKELILEDIQNAPALEQQILQLKKTHSRLKRGILKTLEHGPVSIGVWGDLDWYHAPLKELLKEDKIEVVNNLFQIKD